MSDSLEFGQSVRSTIMEEKDNGDPSAPGKKRLSQKALIIIVICVVCVIAISLGLALYFILRDNDEENPEENTPIPEITQEFSVTIEVFKYRKGRGEKEHEKANLGQPVYFLGEDFKCNETDFEVFLDGQKTDFSKNFTFYVEGNYTVTYKFKKLFNSLENLFRNCYYITNINLTIIAGDNLNDISKMFFNCDGLYELHLDGLNTNNVKRIGQMFYGCSSLKSLDLSKLNFENVQDMTSMFNGMENIESINLINFNSQNVESMSYMFNGCWKLKKN